MYFHCFGLKGCFTHDRFSHVFSQGLTVTLMNQCKHCHNLVKASPQYCKMYQQSALIEMCSQTCQMSVYHVACKTNHIYLPDCFPVLNYELNLIQYIFQKSQNNTPTNIMEHGFRKACLKKKFERENLINFQLIKLFCQFVSLQRVLYCSSNPT